MKAIMAGAMAWSIEILIVWLSLCLLKSEENKVFKRREER